MRTIAIGCDHGGFSLKEPLAFFLRSNGYKLIDVGCFDTLSTHYPRHAKLVVKAVLDGIVIGEDVRGLLLCGTGLGMSIAANRYKGIRAVTVSNEFSAEMSRAHNDSNILCLGARVIGPGLAISILKRWLTTDFEGERHLERLRQIDD